MTDIINKVGRRFGRLTAVEMIRIPGHRIKYRCQCDCGKSAVVRGSHLTEIGTKSCGCLIAQRVIETKTKHGAANYGPDLKLYNVWRSMRRRCSSAKCKDYARYGARGIRVCAEWQADFSVFRSWAFDTGYEPGLSIDRIDNNGNYQPENCRWATQTEQMRNVSTNRKVRRSDGEIFDTVMDAARSVGIAWASGIVKVCRGNKKLAHGYSWEYI